MAPAGRSPWWPTAAASAPTRWPLRRPTSARSSSVRRASSATCSRRATPGIEPKVMDVRGLRYDVDVENDLDEIARQSPGPETSDLLRRFGRVVAPARQNELAPVGGAPGDRTGSRSTASSRVGRPDARRRARTRWRSTAWASGGATRARSLLCSRRRRHCATRASAASSPTRRRSSCRSRISAATSVTTACSRGRRAAAKPPT